ncbi:hypothetical protein BGZ81_003335 [Podila clonocystis]|nr:hypothetical protein BGZ81_003335 [Podila clonocystis]
MLFKNPEGLSTAPLGTSMNMVLFPAITNYLTTASADLTVVKDDPTKLASTALMLNLTVDIIRGVLDTARAQLPPERRISIDPLIADLKALQPMLTAIVQCAGGTPVKDCNVGPYTLYSSLYTASIARMKALAVGARETPINDILQKMGQINPAINDLVAQTAFDDASYSDISDLLDMLNRAAGEVYKCDGQSSRYPTDNCQNITERAKNYLTYAFQYFKTIYAQASLGFVADPLLDTIQIMTNSFLTATNIDITGISNIIAEMLYLLKFIAPTSIQPQLTMLIDKIRAIQATAQECTGNKDCMGPISFVVSVLKVPAVLVDSLLFCGFFNPVGCAPGTALRAVIDQLGNLAKGVAGVTVPVVQAAVMTLKIAVCLVPIVDVLCPVANYANDALTRISTCIAG